MGLSRYCWDVDSSGGCQQTRCLAIPVRFYTHIGVWIMTELCDAVPGVLRGRFPLNSSQITQNSTCVLLNAVFPSGCVMLLFTNCIILSMKQDLMLQYFILRGVSIFLYSPFTFTDCKKSMCFISEDCIDFICTAQCCDWLKHSTTYCVPQRSACHRAVLWLSVCFSVLSASPRFITYRCIVQSPSRCVKGLKDYAHPWRRCQKSGPPGHMAFG